MPTGYTAPITEDPNFSFEQYVWRCARAFGALVMLRDEPIDAPIPERFEPSGYYAERLAQTEARLAYLETLMPSEAEVAAEAAYQERLASRNRIIEQYRAENDRYDAIRGQALAWEPPTPDHAGLKEFMLEQIDISRNAYEPDMPVRLDAKAWWEREMSEARRMLEYDRKGLAEELQRTADRNEWLQRLRQSVPPPTP